MRVVVVSARGLRPGALGVYGSPWVDTPALDGLAAGAVVFDWSFADRADGAGARRAWRSGRHDLPAPEGVPPAAGEQGDLIALLRERGVHTCLVLDESRPDAPGFTPVPEFAAGWDEVRRVEAAGDDTPLERALAEAEKALRRLARRDDWLLWLDLATLLPPWQVPDEFLTPYFEEEPAADDEDEEDTGAADDEPEEEMPPPEPVLDPVLGPVDPTDDRYCLALWQTYVAAVSYLDAGIGQLLEAVEKQGKGEPPVFVLTADAGLPLGEHGVVGAVRAWAHDERVRVPLILRVPGLAPRRVDALTQAVDLAPTLANLFGVSLPSAHGHDLMPLARGEAAAARDYVCCGVRQGEEAEWCLRTADFVFLTPVRSGAEAARRPQLYVKPDDRWEVNDVVQHYPELVDRLRRTLEDYVRASRAPGPLVPPPLPAGEDEGPPAETPREG
jgi:arylsulfatase A-like enzyme